MKTIEILYTANPHLGDSNSRKNDVLIFMEIHKIRDTEAFCIKMPKEDFDTVRSNSYGIAIEVYKMSGCGQCYIEASSIMDYEIIGGDEDKLILKGLLSIDSNSNSYTLNREITVTVIGTR